MKNKKSKKYHFILFLFITSLIIGLLKINLNFDKKVYYFSLFDEFISRNINSQADTIELKVKKDFFHDGNGELFGVQGIDGFSTNNQFELYIANGYKNSLALINKKKSIYRKIKNNTNHKNPTELLADVFYKNDNEIFWTSYRNNVIYKSNNNLKINKKEFAKGFNHPIGISGNDEIIIVADQYNGDIVCLNKEGDEIWRKKYFLNYKLQKNPYGVSVFKNFAYITFSRGWIYNNIIKIDLNGNVKEVIFKSLINGKIFSNIQAIDHDSNGNIYFHDTDNNRILFYSNKMKLLNVLKINSMKRGRGLAILKPDNFILVSGFKRGREYKTELSGFWLIDQIQ